jgi:tetratricopeptide (TPR) repeat protein
MCSSRYFIGITLTFVLLTFLFPCMSQNQERVYGSKHREANRLVDLSKENLEQKNYHQALEQVNQALQYRTDHVDGYLIRAMAKEETGDMPGALIDYQIVLLLDSTYREAAFNRAKLRYRVKQYSRAKLDFKKVLNMSSGGTRMLYFKSASLNKTGNVAVQGITTSYSLEADIYNYIGLCEQALLNFDPSIDCFNKALSLNPVEANYYVNRGLSYSSMGNTDLAISDFKAALSLAPEHAIAQFNLAQEMVVSDNLALDAYDNIIAKNPEFSSAYVNRALAKINKGDISGAIRDYSIAVEREPNNPVFYINRGLANEKANKFRYALADYNKAIKINPGLVIAYRSRGRVLFELKKYQLALMDLDEAINLDPQHGGSFFNRAMIH